MTDVDAAKSLLTEFLAYQRESAIAVLDGLDDAALRKPVLPSGWTALGMIEHLAHAERHWFQRIFTGSMTPLPWPDDDTPPLTTPRPAPVVLDLYREQCRISDRIIAGAALTDAPACRHHDEPLASQTTDLARIILHLIEETARHAGHLDAARELIDGRTGLGPR